MRSMERKRKQADQLHACIRDRKTASVPPRSGAISNLGFFSKHLLTDFVKISNICKFVISDREIRIGMETHGCIMITIKYKKFKCVKMNATVEAPGHT